MKKALALFLVLVTVFSLSGCGMIADILSGMTETTPATEETTAVTTTAEPLQTETTVATEDTEPATTRSTTVATVMTPATKPTETQTSESEKLYPYVGMPIPWMYCTFSLAGVELVDDGAGMLAIRYYYDFTNTSEERSCPQENVMCDVTQNGVSCTYAWMELPDEFIEKYQISDLYVRPGCTVRCMEQFEIDPNGGDVTLTFYTNVEGEKIEATFDPYDLPGAPEEFELEPVPSPEWTYDLYDGGTYNINYYVYIDRAEIVSGAEDERIFRVYFDFTNYSSEETSFWINSMIRLYQDGLELRYGYPSEYVEEDQNYYENVAPGETISVSVCYKLRSTSNVEVELENFMDEEGENLGCNFIVSQ